MRLINLWWGTKSGACLRIPELWFHWRLSLFMYFVVLNQRCCRTCKYNLLDRMLQHEFNTMLNQGYVNTHYFGWHDISEQGISISHLSIPGTVVLEKCYTLHCFQLFSFCSNFNISVKCLWHKKYFYESLSDQFLN